MKGTPISCAAALAVLVGGQAFARPLSESRSEGLPHVEGRERIAVFALGGEIAGIPPEALGRADRAIRRLFADLGRFETVGISKRLAPGRLGELAEEAAARGAKLLAAPSITRLDSFFDETEGRWETDIAAELAIYDASAGTAVIGRVEAEGEGFDDADPELSVSEAVGRLPMLLQYRLGRLAALHPGARILASSGRKLELGVGSESGIGKGDEYELLAEGSAENLAEDPSEGPAVRGEEPAGGRGLVVVERVGPGSARARVLYADGELPVGARLVEVPRQGIDVEPYLRFLVGRAPDLTQDLRREAGAGTIVGLRISVSRGFYGLRPYAAVQVPTAGVRGFGPAFVFPANLLVGMEYRNETGRLSIVPYGGAGTGFAYASRTIYGASASSSETVISHVGGQAYVHLAFLTSRDVRLFAELGGEYWFSAIADLYTDYGGVGFGAGVSIKL